MILAMCIFPGVDFEFAVTGMEIGLNHGGVFNVSDIGCTSSVATCVVIPSGAAGEAIYLNDIYNNGVTSNVLVDSATGGQTVASASISQYFRRRITRSITTACGRLASCPWYYSKRLNVADQRDLFACGQYYGGRWGE